MHFSDVGARQTQAADDGARPGEGATKTSAAKRSAAAAGAQTTSRRRRNADDGGGGGPVKEKKHERGRSSSSSSATRQQQEGGENGEDQQQKCRQGARAQTTARGVFSLRAAPQKIVGAGKKNRSRAQHQRKRGNHGAARADDAPPPAGAQREKQERACAEAAWLIRDQSGQLHRNEDVPVRGKVAATRATPLSRRRSRRT